MLDVTVLLISLIGIFTICAVGIDRKRKYKYHESVAKYALLLEWCKVHRLDLLEEMKREKYTKFPNLNIWDKAATKHTIKLVKLIVKYLSKDQISLYLSRGEISSNFTITSDRPIANLNRDVIDKYKKIFDIYGIVELDIFSNSTAIHILVTLITGHEEIIQLDMHEHKIFA